MTTRLNPEAGSLCCERISIMIEVWGHYPRGWRLLVEGAASIYEAMLFVKPDPRRFELKVVREKSQRPV